MVVECRKCGTRFQLDAARIPESGIRVRCSRCKHAFFLQHPSASRQEAVEAVVEQSVKRGTAGVPGSTQDLPVSGAKATRAAAKRSEPHDSFGAVDDEDDWEFNEDLPSYEDDDDDISQEGFAADSLGHDPGASDSIDLADGGHETTAGASGVGLDPSEMTADDLMSSSMGIETDASSSQSWESGTTDGDPVGALEIDQSEASDDSRSATVGDVRESAFGSVDDFSSLMEPDEHEQAAEAARPVEEANEDPETWDFFGDGIAAGPEASAAPLAEEAKVPARTADFGSDSIQADHLSAHHQWPSLDGRTAISATGRILASVVWVAVLALLGAGIYLGIVGSLDSGVRAPAFVSIGDMRAANVSGHWLETASAGKLYVVTGRLLNPGTQPAAPQVALEISLLGNGRVNESLPIAYAGLGSGSDALRELPYEQLESRQRAAARALVDSAIGPGESAPFVAVFVDLPDAATHFRLQGVDPALLAGNLESDTVSGSGPVLEGMTGEPAGTSAPSSGTTPGA